MKFREEMDTQFSDLCSRPNVFFPVLQEISIEIKIEIAVTESILSVLSCRRPGRVPCAVAAVLKVFCGCMK